MMYPYTEERNSSTAKEAISRRGKSMIFGLCKLAKK